VNENTTRAASSTHQKTGSRAVDLNNESSPNTNTHITAPSELLWNTIHRIFQLLNNECGSQTTNHRLPFYVFKISVTAAIALTNKSRLNKQLEVLLQTQHNVDSAES